MRVQLGSVGRQFRCRLHFRFGGVLAFGGRLPSAAGIAIGSVLEPLEGTKVRGRLPVVVANVVVAVVRELDEGGTLV